MKLSNIGMANKHNLEYTAAIHLVSGALSKVTDADTKSEIDLEEPMFKRDNEIFAAMALSDIVLKRQLEHNKFMRHVQSK